MNDRAAQPLRASDIACDYVRRGWAVVPVPFREKGPQLRGWQTQRINSAEQVAYYFRDPTNIGVILGPASGGLVDVDLDCEEACRLADAILPPTHSLFGRTGKPRSHRLYRINGPAPTCQFTDPARKDSDPPSKDMLVELRGTKTDGSAGIQTVLPGSIHESGELIEWAEDGEPALVEYSVLKQRVIALAVRSLIQRYCPDATTAEQALDQIDPRISARFREWTGSASDGSAQPRAAASDRRSVRSNASAIQLTEADLTKVWTALTFIDARPRDNWLKVGGALHDILAWPVALRREMWDRWSIDHDLGEPKKFKSSGTNSSDTAWQSFDRPYSSQPVTVETIFYLARQAGWDGRTLKPLPDEFRHFLHAVPIASSDDAMSGVTSPTSATDAPLAGPTEDEVSIELKRLAGLPPVQYERERKKAAEKLDFRVSMLDWLVAKERGNENADDALQGRALALTEPEPWPELVDGHALVCYLACAIRRYVVLPWEDGLPIVLWIVHSYVFDLFTCTPRLCISSPEKRCGKTTLLDVIGHLVNRPLSTVDITGAAIFRTVEKGRPTLLFDEADNMFGRHGKAGDAASDILAILNSGHRHGGQVTRIVGEDLEPRNFSTHAPAVMALIGKAGIAPVDVELAKEALPALSH
jgi:Bifunctional DNA primase/polymerase, N-terminal/Primase C terminal 2 (PriCT-2)